MWLVSGRSHGLVCDCCGLLRGPLFDLFERVIVCACHCLSKGGMFGCQCVCSNTLTCDELVCAMAMTWLDCECAPTRQCSDLFWIRYEYSKILTCDESLCAMAITWLACLCVIS